MAGSDYGLIRARDLLARIDAGETIQWRDGFDLLPADLQAGFKAEFETLKATFMQEVADFRTVTHNTLSYDDAVTTAMKEAADFLALPRHKQRDKDRWTMIWNKRFLHEQYNRLEESEKADLIEFRLSQQFHITPRALSDLLRGYGSLYLIRTAADDKGDIWRRVALLLRPWLALYIAEAEQSA